MKVRRESCRYGLLDENEVDMFCRHDVAKVTCKPAGGDLGPRTVVR